MKDPSARVVFVGSATLDAIALVADYPGADDRVVAEQLLYAGGGPAATAAVAASRLGIDCAFVGMVGDDAEGEQVLQGLRSEGVDVSGVAVTAGRATGASVIVVDRGRGTRAICTRPVPSLDVAALKESGGAAQVMAAQWVHVDHLGWGPVTELLGRQPGRRPSVSVDAGNPIAGFTAASASLYVPTVEALRRTYGAMGEGELLDAALADGAGCVVATDGARGSMAATAEGERVAVPGMTTDVVSTLGAGDVFHGALLAATVRGLPLADSLAYANITAALSCRGLDGRSAIPTHDVVLAHLPSLVG